jgi:hypothetical protein
MPNAFLNKLIKDSKLTLVVDKANKTDLDHVYTHEIGGSSVIYKIDKHSDPSDNLYAYKYSSEYSLNNNNPNDSGSLFDEAMGNWFPSSGITSNIIKKCYNGIYDKVYVDRSNKYFGISSTIVHDISVNEDLNDQSLYRITDFSYPNTTTSMRFLLASAREPLIIHPIVQQKDPRLITPIIYGKYEDGAIGSSQWSGWKSSKYENNSFNNVATRNMIEITPKRLNIETYWNGMNSVEKDYVMSFWLANNVFIGDYNGVKIDANNAFKKPSFFSSYKVNPNGWDGMSYFVNLSFFKKYNEYHGYDNIQFMNNRNSFLKSLSGQTMPFDNRIYGNGATLDELNDDFPLKLDIGAMQSSILNDFDQYENEFYTADDYEYVPTRDYTKPSKYNAVRILANASQSLNDLPNRYAYTIFKPDRNITNHPTIRLSADNGIDYQHELPDVVSFCCHFNSNSYYGKGYVSNNINAYCNSPKNEAWSNKYTEVSFNKIAVDLNGSYFNLDDSSSSYSYFNPVLKQLESYYGKNFIYNNSAFGTIYRRKICNFFQPYSYTLEIQIFNDDVDINDQPGYTSIGLRNEISLTGYISTSDIGICKDLQLYEILKNKNPYILPKFTRVQLNETVERIKSNDYIDLFGSNPGEIIEHDIFIDNNQYAIASEKKCISQKHKIRPDIFYKFNKYGYIDKSQLTYNYNRT